MSPLCNLSFAISSLLKSILSTEERSIRPHKTFDVRRKGPGDRPSLAYGEIDLPCCTKNRSSSFAVFQSDGIRPMSVVAKLVVAFEINGQFLHSYPNLVKTSRSERSVCATSISSAFSSL